MKEAIMAEVRLEGTTRTQFGKGAARQLRREKMIPAVMYELGETPTHVALPAHETMLALRQANVLFSIVVDGKPQLAVTKDVQRDPVRQIIEHIDLIKVKAGEKITVEVPVHIIGESASGTMHTTETQTLSVQAEATHLPQVLEIDITGLEAGTMIHAKDVKLPQGAVLESDPELGVVHITMPQGEETAETAAETEAGEETAEAGEETEEAAE
jgi:large subunit ribosomal protein L25